MKAVCVLLVLLACSLAQGAKVESSKPHHNHHQQQQQQHVSLLTEAERAIVARATRKDVAGWVSLKLSGSPYEVGLQHGSLAAAEFAQALATYIPLTYETTGKTYEFFVQSAVTMQKHMIPADLLEEMRGIADGLAKSGIKSLVNINVDDIIGWNANMEMTGYWWPTARTAMGYADRPEGSFAKSHCSAFVATGSATADGRPVIGHETFTEFWNGQYLNFVFDITPSTGARMLFQGAPGYISSMTDFWINSYGLAVTETTIVGYSGYDTKKSPEWINARVATQQAKTIQEWADLMTKPNNGGYANSWLLAQMTGPNAGQIASLELGLIYQNLTILSDGYIQGDNAPTDARIRNLECSDVGFSDVRQQTGARRTRWPQLLNKYHGQINVTIGQKMLGDTYDPYLKKENPSSRCICGMYDVDPQFYVSDPNAVWNVPYTPAGSVDGKVASAKMVEQMTFSGVFGRANAVAFDASQFLSDNPQWNWQAPYLLDRPSQPWVTF